ncbi:hypothetical protein ADUPG1_006663, partial [Aduncisulcus paluster]
ISLASHAGIPWPSRPFPSFASVHGSVWTWVSPTCKHEIPLDVSGVAKHSGSNVSVLNQSNGDLEYIMNIPLPSPISPIGGITGELGYDIAGPTSDYSTPLTPGSTSMSSVSIGIVCICEVDATRVCVCDELCRCHILERVERLKVGGMDHKKEQRGERSRRRREHRNLASQTVVEYSLIYTFNIDMSSPVKKRQKKELKEKKGKKGNKPDESFSLSKSDIPMLPTKLIPMEVGGRDIVIACLCETNGQVCVYEHRDEKIRAKEKRWEEREQKTATQSTFRGKYGQTTKPISSEREEEEEDDVDEFVCVFKLQSDHYSHLYRASSFASVPAASSLGLLKHSDLLKSHSSRISTSSPPPGSVSIYSSLSASTSSLSTLLATSGYIPPSLVHAFLEDRESVGCVLRYERGCPVLSVGANDSLSSLAGTPQNEREIICVGEVLWIGLHGRNILVVDISVDPWQIIREEERKERIQKREREKIQREKELKKRESEQSAFDNEMLKERRRREEEERLRNEFRDEEDWHDEESSLISDGDESDGTELLQTNELHQSSIASSSEEDEMEVASKLEEKEEDETKEKEQAGNEENGKKKKRKKRRTFAYSFDYETLFKSSIHVHSLASCTLVSPKELHSTHTKRITPSFAPSLPSNVYVSDVVCCWPSVWVLLKEKDEDGFDSEKELAEEKEFLASLGLGKSRASLGSSIERSICDEEGSSFLDLSSIVGLESSADVSQSTAGDGEMSEVFVGGGEVSGIEDSTVSFMEGPREGVRGERERGLGIGGVALGLKRRRFRRLRWKMREKKRASKLKQRSYPSLAVVFSLSEPQSTPRVVFWGSGDCVSMCAPSIPSITTWSVNTAHVLSSLYGERTEEDGMVPVGQGESSSEHGRTSLPVSEDDSIMNHQPTSLVFEEDGAFSPMSIGMYDMGTDLSSQAQQQSRGRGSSSSPFSSQAISTPLPPVLGSSVPIQPFTPLAITTSDGYVRMFDTMGRSLSHLYSSGLSLWSSENERKARREVEICLEEGRRERVRERKEERVKKERKRRILKIGSSSNSSASDSLPSSIISAFSSSLLPSSSHPHVHHPLALLHHLHTNSPLLLTSARTFLGYTPLLLALKHGYKAGVEWILRKGAEIGKREVYGAITFTDLGTLQHSVLSTSLTWCPSPLALAACLSKLASPQCTLSTQKVTLKGETMLHRLVKEKGLIDNSGLKRELLVKWERRRRVIRLAYHLIMSDSNLRSIPDSKSRTPIHTAASVGNLLFIALCVGDRHVLAKNTEGILSMSEVDDLCDILAVSSRRSKFDTAAVVSVPDFHANTALHLAARSSSSSDASSEIVRLLYEYGSPQNPTNMEGLCPIHLAILNNRSGKVVDALLKGGADLSKEDSDGDLPLHKAAASHNIELLFKLLKYYKENPEEVDVNARNAKGETALHLLVSNGIGTTVEEFLSFGVAINIDAQDKQGRTALFRAVSNLRSETERYAHISTVLLKHGADVGIENNNQQTVFNIISPKKEMVMLLIRNISREPTWIRELKRCQVCHNDFSLRRRRHHCRVCGRNACGQCCTKKDVQTLGLSDFWKKDSESKKKGAQYVCHECLGVIEHRMKHK